MVDALVSVAYNNAVRCRQEGRPALFGGEMAKRVFPTGSVRRVFEIESGTR